VDEQTEHLHEWGWEVVVLFAVSWLVWFGTWAGRTALVHAGDGNSDYSKRVSGG